MSFISLIFGLGGVQTQIGALTLDALLNEVTELRGDVSQYAVEEGPDISDHITQRSEDLSLSGVVTAAGVTLFGAGGRSKLIAAKDALRQIHEQRIPLTIITGMDIYTNMGMENARIGRDNKGDLITIDCDFKKIVKVTTRKADIPPEKTKGKATGKSGKTGTKAGKVSSASPGGSSAPATPFGSPQAGPEQSVLKDLIKGKQKPATQTGNWT